MHLSFVFIFFLFPLSLFFSSSYPLQDIIPRLAWNIRHEGLAHLLWNHHSVSYTERAAFMEIGLIPLSFLFFSSLLFSTLLFCLIHNYVLVI